jgi:hypothetical protein
VTLGLRLKNVVAVLSLATRLGASAAAFASDGEPRYALHTEEQTQRLSFNFGVESGSFARGGVSVTGIGPAVGISLAISDDFRGDVLFGQTFSSLTSLGVLYTAVRTRLNYALLGSYLPKRDRILVGDATVAELKSIPASVLGIALGVDQYFFNGSQVVAPASGGSVGVSYEFPLAGLRWFIKAESGLLYLNNQATVPRLFAGGLVLFLR